MLHQQPKELHALKDDSEWKLQFGQKSHVCQAHNQKLKAASVQAFKRKLFFQAQATAEEQLNSDERLRHLDWKQSPTKENALDNGKAELDEAIS